jgi:hypothetical protein
MSERQGNGISKIEQGEWNLYSTLEAHRRAGNLALSTSVRREETYNQHTAPVIAAEFLEDREVIIGEAQGEMDHMGG